jgi:uncharacterized protein
MLRFLVILIVAILLITLLRAIIGVLMKGLANLTSSSTNTSTGRQRDQTAAELKKDPVCGAYVPATTSIKKMVGGSVLHFCSEACRDRYRA